MISLSTHSATSQFVNAREAARLLGVSLNHFRVSIAPEIPGSDFSRRGSRKKLLRWSVESLQDWADARGAR
jgi:hypothetical protein